MLEKYKSIEGYVYAAFTDQLVLGVWQDEMENILEKEEKLLEIRIFNQDMEVKCYRASIGRAFIERTIDDTTLENCDSYEEKQLLDIDTVRSATLFQNTGDVLATGGGRYHLPVPMTEKTAIITKQYIRKNEQTGQAELFDWRLVGFTEE